jgi:hypothetical protein
MKGNGVRWLKELKTGKLTNYANEAAQYGHKVLDKLSELLTRVKGQIPEKFQNIITKVNDTLNSLAEVKGRLNAQFAGIGDDLVERLGRTLDEGVENTVEGSTQKTLRKQQVSRAPLRSTEDMLGRTQGGPGMWEPSPKRAKGAEYQEQIAGVERGAEYKVNGVLFDGYDPRRKVLLDAKDWQKWPPGDKKFWHEGVLKDAERQRDAAQGVPIEWHVSTREKADVLNALFKSKRIGYIKTVHTPKI